MSDKTTISKQRHELKTAAEAIGCREWEVMRALDELGTNKRQEVYDYIKKQKEEVIESNTVFDSKALYDQMRFLQVTKEATEVFDPEGQIDMLIEEMAEVTQAICKWRRKRWTHMPEDDHTLNNLHEELADLSIVLQQMDSIFDSKKIADWRRKKINRLTNKINEHKSKEQ